jgi:hypothetical protein
MGITTGINITCGDLQAAGGIRSIIVRAWQTGDDVTYVNSSTQHSISSIQKSGPANADWFVYEFKNETPSLTVSASKENGSTVYECSLSFMMPEMDNKKGAVIQHFMDQCMMVIAVGNNGKYYVLGASQKYQNENTDTATRNQTYASMTTAEGNSGAAYNDDSGWTVTLGCKQWEAPRLYTGTLTMYDGGDFAATTT